MNRLPSIAPQQANESIQAYGARALTFVLSTGVTATLADRDLDLADLAAMLAVSAPEISAPALARLNRCRLLLQSTLRTRQRERLSSTVGQSVPQPPERPAGDGNDGSQLAT